MQYGVRDHQEIAEDESSNQQTVRINNSELNRRVQATSTSETSFNATADLAEPQQVAEYILHFNEDTGLSR
jgi:hypothetical protein